jgi:hypothetical protein
MRLGLNIVLTLALVGGGSLAFAHETTGAATRNEKREVIIIKHVDDDETSSADDGIDAKAVNCGGEPQVDVSDETKGADGKQLKRSRVIVCSHGAPNETFVKSLRDARERLAKQEDLSETVRAKALAAIDDAIARHSTPK